ncbi:hypothetical protein Tco_0813664 [Tanacetum coccineum]
MAQHVIPAAQLVPQYKPIGRCNNYTVLQSIPCSPECKIVGLILLDHCLSHALTATDDVPAVDTLHLPVETPENLFVAPANIHTIEAFMNRVGYQDVIDKVSAFFMKNLAQPWKTMFKVFNRCLTTRTSGHDQTKINILQLFHVLIVADLMKKFPNIPKRLEEDYHSIKDDVPLRTHRITPSAHRSPTVFASPPETKKRHQIKGKSSSPRNSLKITIKRNQLVEKDDDDSEDRIEPGSHKDNPEVVVDDDDNEREKKDDEMGRALRRMCRRQGYMIQDMERKCVSIAKFWETHNKIDDILHEVVLQIAENDPDAFRSEVPAFISQEFKAHAPAIIEELFKNHVQFNVIHVHPTTTTSTETESSTNLRKDDFHSHHDEHQDDDAHPEGEKRVKRSKKSKRSKSARGLSPKAFKKDSNKTNYEENRVKKKYILSLHKIHAEEFPEPDLEEKLNRWVRKEFKTFMKRVHDFQLGIESYQIKVNLTAPTLTFPGIEEHAPYTIVEEPQMGLIYLYSKDEKRVMYLEEIVKLCDATLEKVLNEIKLRMFESKFLKKPPLLGELDQDRMKAYEREIYKRLSHQQQMRR